MRAGCDRPAWGHRFQFLGLPHSPSKGVFSYGSGVFSKRTPRETEHGRTGESKAYANRGLADRQAASFGIGTRRGSSTVIAPCWRWEGSWRRGQEVRLRSLLWVDLPFWLGRIYTPCGNWRWDGYRCRGAPPDVGSRKLGWKAVMRGRAPLLGCPFFPSLC